MHSLIKAPGAKGGKKMYGRLRTKRHMRKKYGDDPTPLNPSSLQKFSVIGSFILFGLLLFGTLYAIFG